MEKEILNVKEIKNFLNKYDVSYWNLLITKLIKIGIFSLENKDPNIYIMDDIDNYIKEINTNKIKFKKDPYEGMWILKDDINDNNNNNLSLLNKNINIENSFKDNIFNFESRFTSKKYTFNNVIDNGNNINRNYVIYLEKNKISDLNYDYTNLKYDFNRNYNVYNSSNNKYSEYNNKITYKPRFTFGYY